MSLRGATYKPLRKKNNEKKKIMQTVKAQNMEKRDIAIIKSSLS